MNFKIFSIIGLMTLLGCGGGSGDSGGSSSSLTGSSGTATFRLINSTGTSIAGAYITLSSSSTWGPN